MSTLQVDTRPWQKSRRKPRKPRLKNSINDAITDLDWYDGLLSKYRIACIAIADHRNGGYSETLRSRKIQAWNHPPSLQRLLGKTDYFRIRRILELHQEQKFGRKKSIDALTYDKVYRCYYERGRYGGTVATISRRHPVTKLSENSDHVLYGEFLRILAEADRHSQ